MRRRRFLASAASTAGLLGGVGVTGARTGRSRDRVRYRFDVVERRSRSPSPQIDVSIGPDARVIDVEGRILGSNTCKSARIASAEFDGEELHVVVETYDPTDSWTVCGMAITGVEYEGQFVLDESASTVVVEHDGVDDTVVRETPDDGPEPL